MTNDQDLAAVARDIVDTNLYMTLGTADQNGRPWVSPVYYAPFEYSEFFWVSSPDAKHSRNLASRPEVSIVIFDSRAPIGAGQAVYMSAVAGQLSDAELLRGIGIFSRRSHAHGARLWTREDVLRPARHRLYRATVLERFVLGPDDERRLVTVV
jgi:Pyridoxamine 5'-phosphate oxidase